MTPVLVGSDAWKGLVKNNRKLVTSTFTCSEVLTPSITLRSDCLVRASRKQQYVVMGADTGSQTPAQVHLSHYLGRQTLLTAKQYNTHNYVSFTCSKVHISNFLFNFSV